MTPRRVLVALLVAGGMAPVAPAAPDSLVVFRSGKTMRVASHREEGQWVFLTVTPRSNPKDEPSEIGVLKESILRYETPQVAAGPINPTPGGAIGRSANGVVRGMTEADARAAAMSTRPGGPSMEEAREQVAESIPAADTLEGNKALVEDGAPLVPLAGGGGGGGPAWEVDVEKAGAGSVIRAPLRNMKMSKKYIDRARQLHEQRQAAKAAAAAAAAQAAAAGTQSGEAPPPPPESPQP